MAWLPFRISGLLTDGSSSLAPPTVWTELTNAAHLNGEAGKLLGDNATALVGNPLRQVEWMCGTGIFTPSPVPSIVYQGRSVATGFTGVSVYGVGLGHVNVTPGAWANLAGTGNRYTGGNFSDGVLFNDALHGPGWYDPVAGVAVQITASTFFSVRPYKYMAIGLNDLAGAAVQNTIRHSASAVPGAAPNVWAPLPGNDAGDFDLTTSGNGIVIDGGALGPDFIIYAENSTHLMTYVGGSTVMAVRDISYDSGIMARNCWADVGIGHAVLTKDDVVLVTPSGIKSLVQGRVRQSMFANLFNNDGRHLLSQVWYDRVRNRLWIMLGTGAETNRALQAWVYEFSSDTWGRRSEQRSSHAIMAVLENSQPVLGQPKLLVSDPGDGVNIATSNVYFHETAGAPSDPPPDAVFFKDDMDLGDTTARKTVQGIRLLGTGSATVYVKIGVKETLNAAYVYTAEQSYIMNTTQFGAFLVSGRWVAVSVRVPQGSTQTFITGFDLQVAAGGQW